MGRFAILSGVWFLGYLIGFVGYLAAPSVGAALVALLPFLANLDAQLVGAMLAGLASSFVTVFGVTIWAYSSRGHTALAA